jgi:hypothetical protein
MGYAPMRGSNRESINIQLVRVGLVISVDPEHETRMDHIMSSPASFP